MCNVGLKKLEEGLGQAAIHQEQRPIIVTDATHTPPRILRLESRDVAVNVS